ncbi:MAG: hypothetical protein NVSMB25_18980 [Thermoleophilaceae bacterium]
MDLSRVRRFEWLSAALGLALLGSMFLHWYRSDASSGAFANAWQALSVIDVVIALAALLGISLVPATAGQRAAAVAQAIAAFTTLAAGISVLLVAYRAVSPPDPYGARQAGVFVGLVLTIALTLAAWRSMADESFPSSLETSSDIPRIAAPSPDGAPRTAP